MWGMDLGNAFPLDISGHLTVVENKTLVANATSVVFSGLDVDSDNIYFLYYNINNAAGANANIGLYANNDTTATNYYTQVFQASGAVSTPARSNSSWATSVVNAHDCIGFAYIDLNPADYFRALCYTTNNISTSVDIWLAGITKTATTANLTQLDVLSDQADGIGTGSILTLYKIKES